MPLTLAYTISASPQLSVTSLDRINHEAVAIGLAGYK